MVEKELNEQRATDMKRTAMHKLQIKVKITPQLDVCKANIHPDMLPSLEAHDS
jgi:hypothetical protein